MDCEHSIKGIFPGAGNLTLVIIFQKKVSSEIIFQPLDNLSPQRFDEIFILS